MAPKTPPTLTTRQLNRALLARQLLLARKRMKVSAAIHAVAGMQSQEPKDPYVALWSRLSGFTGAALEAAAAARTIVRGSYLRATIHTVSVEDYAAFRGLLQAVIGRGLRIGGDVMGGFEPAALEVAARALMAKEPLTALVMGKALAKRFPKAKAEGLARWIRAAMPLVMVPTADRWGFSRPPRFVPADGWIDRPLVARGEAGPRAVEALIERCLSAFGPASSSDIRTWSNLAGVKPVLETMRPRLRTFVDEAGRELFDLPDAPRPRADTPAPPRFLPEYDNTFLSHADRSRVQRAEHDRHFSTPNGRRLRAVLVDGFVRAAWSSARVKDRASIRVAMFERFDKATVQALSTEAEALVRFLEPDAKAFDVVAERA